MGFLREKKRCTSRISSAHVAAVIGVISANQCGSEARMISPFGCPTCCPRAADRPTSQETASLLRQHQDAVERLAEVPEPAVDSATQIITEVGPAAVTFPSGKHLSSWVGAGPGEQRKRRREPLPLIPAGQPPHAATQSGRECRREGQRKYLRNCLSALGPAPRTQPSHRSHSPSTVSLDLVDPAPSSPLRGTRSSGSGYQTISASTHRQNDLPTPQTRLPSRTSKSASR